MTYRPDQPRAQGRIGMLIKRKWRIDSRLGAGGMATVYAATHRNGNRVAIKMLNYDWSHDATVRARFLREGYVANAVGHPGAVKILDDDVAEDGCVFLVMELLEGESLEARRERLGGRLPIEEVFTVGDQLLDLLDVAHKKGIIHRDIKPQNIFVTNEGVVKVLDFGIARMRWSTGETTGTGLMLGTPDFMSPEQAAGLADQIDARSDLWSVGATLFTLLSGQSVHHAETLRDYLLATATVPARSLITAAPTAPRHLVAVVDRALELHKERRWPDARAMQDALRWAYKALTQGAQSGGAGAGMSMTAIASAPPSSRDQFDEVTEYQPIPPDMGDADDRTVAHPPPSSALAMTPPSEPPTVMSAAPVTPLLGQPATRPLYPVTPPQMPIAQLFERPVHDQGGIVRTMPPAQSAPHMSAPYGPGTLHAHSADPRVQTGSTRRRGPLGVIAIIVLVAAAAGIAIYVAALGVRDPRRGARAPLESANAAPPSATPLPPPKTLSADAAITP